MARIRIALLWHQHQPYYRDLVGGAHRMPWVRLHGAKDYYGMARLLRDAGGAVRANVNLVPSLLEQLMAYVAGEAVDPHLAVSAKPAEELGTAERILALDWFFMANWDRMVRPSRRYGELLARRRPGRHPADLLVGDFTTADYRDLQVWANLAWFHRTVLEEDEGLRELVARDRGFTEEDKAYVLRRQREVIAGVIPLHRELADRGIVELTTSPCYHPILPLLVDMECARISLPGTPLPFRRQPLPEDAREHLRSAVEKHTEVFGSRPRGLWPSEGSVSPGMLPLVREAGFEWLATDQDVLAVSRLEEGYQEADLYHPWRVPAGEGDLAIVFRDHRLSDLVGFDYQRMDGARAAGDLLERIRAIGRRHPHHELLVTLILDGENAWEHYPEGGVPFLRSFYGRLGDADDLETVRLSDHLEARPPDRTLPRLHSGSWIHSNFAIWIGHEEDVRAWEYLFRVREDLAAAEREGADPGALALAWKCLYVAEGSDWTWWYGEDHTSGIDEEFDELYRTHLKNVYRALGRDPPAFLDVPVNGARRSRAATEPAAFLHVVPDGRETSFFEWLNAGRYRPARGESLSGEGGAMHRGGRGVLGDLCYGFDRTRLFLRADLEDDWRESAAAEALGLAVRFLIPRGRVLLVPDLLAAAPGLTLDGAAVGGAEVGVDEIVEISVPFAALGASVGDELAFQVELHRGEVLAERLPAAETVRLVVPPEDFDATRWQV